MQLLYFICSKFQIDSFSYFCYNFIVYLYCTFEFSEVVVCDVPPAVEGARTDGVNHVYNSKVFYQCAKGQHFAYERKRQLNVTCYPDGKWKPDLYTLRCSGFYFFYFHEVTIYMINSHNT